MMQRILAKLNNNDALNATELAYLESISPPDTAEGAEDADYPNDEESFTMPPAGRTSDGGINSAMVNAQKSYLDEVAFLNDNILKLSESKNGISILVKPEFPPHLVIKKLHSDEVVKKWYLISQYMKRPEVIRTFDLLNCVKPELHDSLVLSFNRRFPSQKFEVYELPSKPLKIQVQALFSAVSDIHRDNDVCDAIRKLDMFINHRALDKQMQFVWSPDQAEIDLKEMYSKIQILIEIGKVRLGEDWIVNLGISNLLSAVYTAFAREKTPLVAEFPFSVFKKDCYQKITKSNPDPIKRFFTDVFEHIDYLLDNRSRTKAFTNFTVTISLAPKSGKMIDRGRPRGKNPDPEKGEDEKAVPPVATLPNPDRRKLDKSSFLCFEVAKGKLCTVPNCPYSHTVTADLKAAALKYLEKKKNKDKG